MIPDDKDLSHKDLRGASYSDADLESANLEYANLSGANLRQVRLTNARLLGAILEEANLEGAILQGADLRQANLARANLSQSYCMCADFRGANLNGANLQGAIVEAARFEEASLENTNLHHISYNRATLWPQGFRPASHVTAASPDQVVSVGDLINFMKAMARSYAIDYGRPLEDYLRALWVLIARYRDEPVTPNLFARLFAGSFWQDPGKFREDWFLHPLSLDNEDSIGDYEYLQHAIITQVVELHSASGSPQKQSLLSNWSSLEVEDYVDAAAGGFRAHCQYKMARGKGTANSRGRIGRNLASTQCSWRDLADILELGKVYE